VIFVPELPEVEIIRRQLLPLVGSEIIRARADDEDLFADGLTPENVVACLQGKTINDFERYGKFLLLEAGENWLIFHPRMSGKIWHRPDPPPLPDRVKLELDLSDTGEEKLFFTSLRRFSRFYWQGRGNPVQHPKIAKMGPDPLHSEYTFDNFKNNLSGRRGAIKNLLLDQSFIAGIGNIYACEICFRSGIDPRRSADDISSAEARNLCDTISEVLKEAIAAGGSSLNQESSATVYRGVGGEVASYADQHRVYGRKNENCPRCDGEVKKIKLGGRSTFFCPVCQK
jgi:formamidopyrimidine-DNA glycosylase